MLKSNETAYSMAARKAQMAEQWVGVRADFGLVSNDALDCDTRIRSLVQPGYYEHFKSSKKEPKFYRVYRVLAHVNIHTGAHAYQVDYASLYGKQKNRRGLRELLGPDGFLTPIDRPEYRGPRFIFCGTKRPKDA